MVINENTLRILKSFNSINSSIAIEAGNQLRTVHEQRTILGSAKLDQEFPQDFAIYDLGQFLSTLNLVDEPRITYDQEYLTIQDMSGRTKIKYYYADSNTVQKAQEVQFPVPFATATIDRTSLNKLIKAAGTFGYEHFTMTPGTGGSVVLTLLDPADSTSNEFSIVVDADVAEGANFEVIYKVSNLKMIEGDYRVELARGASQWTKVDEDLVYFVVIEGNSTYEGV